MSEQPEGNSNSVVTWLVAIAAAATLVGALAWTWAGLFILPTPPLDFVDLDYYRAALRVVVSGQPLFAALPYPPIAVLVIAPLGGVSVAVGNQLWTVASLIMAALLGFTLAARALQSRSGAAKLRLLEVLTSGSLVTILLLFSLPMASQLACGQVSLIVITLSFLDVAKVLPRKLQGIGVGIAGAIKLFPLIFIPYYLVTGQRRQAGVAAITFGVMTAIGFAIFPGDSWYFWSHLGKNDQFGDPTRTDNLSIHSMLIRWIPLVGNSAWGWVVVGALVAAVALWRARVQYLRGDQMAAALTVGAAAAVMPPIAWPHYQTWVILALLWLIRSEKRWLQLFGGVGYLAYLMIYLSSVSSTLPMQAVDLLVLIPVLIGIFGLSRVSKQSEMRQVNNSTRAQ